LTSDRKALYFWYVFEILWIDYVVFE